MKIGYLCADWKKPVLRSSGDAVHIQELCSALAVEGHDVFVIAAKRGVEAPSVPHPPRIYAVRPSSGAATTGAAGYARPASMSGQAIAARWGARAVGGDIARLGWTQLWNRYYTARARAIVRRERPDVLYERHAANSAVGARLAREFGLPLIVEMNASFTFSNEWWHRHSPLYPRAVRHAETQIFGAADRIVVVSPHLEQYLHRIGIDDAKVLLLLNGADPERFRPDAGRAAEVRAKYGLDGTLLAGFVGTLRPWHGLELLLDSAIALARQGRPLRCLIVGDGPLRAQLEQRVEREGLQGSVLFTGRVPRHEVPGIISALDIALAPAPRLLDFHFSPIKLFEYMAAAKPVIAARYPDTERVIADHHNGLLVEPGASQALSAALIELIDSPTLRERLGRQARLTVQQQFTWQANARRIIGLYADIVAARATKAGVQTAAG